MEFFRDEQLTSLLHSAIGVTSSPCIIGREIRGLSVKIDQQLNPSYLTILTLNLEVSIGLNLEYTNRNL